MNTRPILLVTLVALSAACTQGEEQPRAMGTLEWDRIELIAEVSERITEIGVTEGDAVAQGDILARLNDERLQLRVDQASAARDQAAARLAELKRGPRAELIEQGRARVAAAKAVLTNADEQLTRTKELVERKMTGQADLDRRISLRDSAREDLNAAQADLHALVEGTTLEELQQAEAALHQAELEVSRIKVDRERLNITAPRDGVVDAIPYKLGDQPPPGAPVIVMLVGDKPYARVYVPEPIRVHISSGSQAEVAVDGLDQPLQGRVRTVRNDASFTPYFALTEHDRSRLSYLAEVTIEEGGDNLPAGVPVQVTFPGLPVTSDSE